MIKILFFILVCVSNLLISESNARGNYTKKNSGADNDQIWEKVENIIEILVENLVIQNKILETEEILEETPETQLSIYDEPKQTDMLEARNRMFVILVRGITALRKEKTIEMITHAIYKLKEEIDITAEKLETMKDKKMLSLLAKIQEEELLEVETTQFIRKELELRNKLREKEKLLISNLQTAMGFSILDLLYLQTEKTNSEIQNNNDVEVKEIKESSEMKESTMELKPIMGNVEKTVIARNTQLSASDLGININTFEKEGLRLRKNNQLNHFSEYDVQIAKSKETTANVDIANSLQERERRIAERNEFTSAINNREISVTKIDRNIIENTLNIVNTNYNDSGANNYFNWNNNCVLQ